MLPDLANNNTFDAINTFSSNVDGTWTNNPNGVPTLTGAICLTAGGMAVRNNLACGTLGVNATTDSTTSTDGALVVAGGLGVAKSVHLGSTLDVAAAATVNTAHVVDTTDSTAPQNGALIVAGGVGVAKQLHVGGDVHCDALDAAVWSATNPLAGALIVEGGAAVRTNLASATATIHDTAEATNRSTGALQVAGGVGVAKQLACNTALVEATTNSTNPSSGAAVVAGGLGVGRSLYVGEDAHVVGDVYAANGHLSATTASTSTATGALTVSGGAGIAGNLYLGGAAHVAGSAYCEAAVPAAWDATGTLSGGLVVEGGAAVRQAVACGSVYAKDATASTSSATGAAVVTGGLGVGGAVYCGGEAHVENTANSTWANNGSSLTGALQVVGGVAVAKDVQCANGFLHGTTNATSKTTGTLVVDGGVGIAADVYCDQLRVVSTTPATSQNTGALVVNGGLGVQGSVYCTRTYDPSAAAAAPGAQHVRPPPEEGHRADPRCAGTRVQADRIHVHLERADDRAHEHHLGRGDGAGREGAGAALREPRPQHRLLRRRLRQIGALPHRVGEDVGATLPRPGGGQTRRGGGQFAAIKACSALRRRTATTRSRCDPDADPETGPAANFGSRRTRATAPHRTHRVPARGGTTVVDAPQGHAPRCIDAPVDHAWSRQRCARRGRRLHVAPVRRCTACIGRRPRVAAPVVRCIVEWTRTSGDTSEFGACPRAVPRHGMMSNLCVVPDHQHGGRAIGDRRPTVQRSTHAVLQRPECRNAWSGGREPHCRGCGTSASLNPSPRVMPGDDEQNVHQPRLQRRILCGNERQNFFFHPVRPESRHAHQPQRVVRDAGVW